MKQIELIVSPDGSTRLETKGFAGSQCQQASRFLEQTLGQKQSEQMTADFFRENSSVSQQARQQ